MDPLQAKYEALQQTLAEMGGVVIGFSGGVDSTFLLKVAHDVLNSQALAVIGISETYPEREYREALQLAKQIGVRTRVVHTEETDRRKFLENPPDRCYYCKTELFTKLRQIAAEEGLAHIADGTHAEDVRDFRPGLRALREQAVRSPLREVGLTKLEIRQLSQRLGLPTWDKPSFACLSSRFPYGFGIDKEKLKMVDAAENVLRDFSFRVFRVRHYGDTARIEVSPNEIARFADAALRAAIVKKLKELGYTYITLDLEGYRTGSMNEVLPLEVIAKVDSRG